MCLTSGSESFRAGTGAGAGIRLTLLGSGVDVHVRACAGGILCVYMQPYVTVNVCLLLLERVFK